MANATVAAADVTRYTATWGGIAWTAGATLFAVAIAGPSTWGSVTSELAAAASAHASDIQRCAPAAGLGFVCAYTSWWLTVFLFQQGAYLVLVEGWPRCGRARSWGWGDISILMRPGTGCACCGSALGLWCDPACWRRRVRRAVPALVAGV